MTTSPGHFHWKLKDTLDTRGLTRYALQQKAGVAMNTVRAMYDGTPERVDFSTIEKVVAALQELTGQPMTAADVLIWEQVDLAETAAVLADHPEILERLERLERGEEEFYPIEEVAAKYGVKL